MVCHRENEGEVNFPTPSVFELTSPKDWPVKGRYERKSVTRKPRSKNLLNKVTNPGQNEGQSYLHSMTYNQLDKEGNEGHSSSMTGGNRGRRKSQLWMAKHFGTKMIPFRQRKFGKESLVWGQKSADKDIGSHPKLRVPSCAKRIFSSRQTLAKERRQVRQLRGCHSLVKEMNQKIKPWKK